MKKDELSRELVEDSRRMFLGTQILGTPNCNPTVEAVRKMPIEQLRATIQVAWSTYGWLRYANIILLSPPLLYKIGNLRIHRGCPDFYG
jgi:hypothetical protein